jgi:hypothetical protein
VRRLFAVFGSTARNVPSTRCRERRTERPAVEVKGLGLMTTYLLAEPAG